MNTTVSFPGLGIDEVTFSRVAFSVFGKDIYWYGVIIVLGVAAAVLHAYLRSKREGIKVDDLLDLTIFIVLFGVLGARLYYVATTWDGRYKDFIDVIAIWDGGLAIYGGIIAGATALVVVCLIKKINVFRVMDMVGPGVMIAQAIGRWGNFANGEAFGYEVAESSPLYFLRMGVLSDFTGKGVMKYYHPTFLYESLWNVLGFVLITILYKKKKFNGQNALMYLAWYGFGRMFIEGLRTDSLYVGPFRISQVVGALCFVVFGGLLVAGLILSRMGKLDRAFGGLLVAPAAPLTEEEPGVVAESTAQTQALDGEDGDAAVDPPETEASPETQAFPETQEEKASDQNENEEK